MKKYVLPAVFAVAVVTGAPALAADLKAVYKAPPPPVSYNPWDVAIGGAVATDYNFRGISQSEVAAAGFAYIEGRYNPNVDGGGVVGEVSHLGRITGDHCHLRLRTPSFVGGQQIGNLSE